MSMPKMLCRIGSLALVAFTAASCGVSVPPDLRCCGIPAGTPLAPSVSSDDATLHWQLSRGCIRTTYSREVSGHQADIRAALVAWSGPSCSSVCFEEPVEGTPAVREDTDAQQLHFGVL